MKHDIKFAIFLASTRFLESGVQKLRPVIAVSKPYGKHNVVIVIPVSSQPDLAEVDVVLEDWKDAGLLKPSVARIHRLTAILRADLIEQIGEITPKDEAKIINALRQLLELN